MIRTAGITLQTAGRWRMQELKMNRDAASTRAWAGMLSCTAMGAIVAGLLATCGSMITWRADPLLGLFSTTGLQYSNLTRGDGLITLLIGAAITAFFIAGFLFQSKLCYLLAVISSLALIVVSIFEIVTIQSAPGITSTGTGLYMVLGSGFAGASCGMGGYFIAVEKAGLDS